MKIVIAGGPGTGKTTLANEMAEEKPGVFYVYHTDDLAYLKDWSRESLACSQQFNLKWDWINEGVVIPRALRKWLKEFKTGKPCDTAIWLSHPLIELTPGQLAMAKACLTVWSEIEPELVARGVTIERR